ncbi:MAG: 6,7-dimethyl-8-ribityllumazine synthase [Fuscovulum sp.]|jgi:6,7-dimethyl-8-ribityllumazine synthase|nr:6,7-dimethyl-8-ribityllumazine synthase [Fuscovulum sp.]
MTKTLRIAFLKARWHADIVDQAHAGFCARLAEAAPTARVDSYEVPGAFELPLLAQRLALTGRYDVIAAAALVVDGGIYRHDFVAQAVVSGLMEVQLKTGVPVLSVSLTPHNFQPVPAHVDFFRAHFVEKGREAAEAALAVTQALPVIAD